MSTEDLRRSLRWLVGVALVDAPVPLPMLACASKSVLRVAELGGGACREAHDLVGVEAVTRDRPGLRLIFNDDHGMAPSVTIVNQTTETVVLQGVRPSALATDNGTYDLDALLAGGPRTIEPGAPLVIRIKDIGRNAGEPYRIGDTAAPVRGGDAADDTVS